MTTRRLWIDRKFEMELPPEALPDIIERLRGTPARIEERVRGLEPALLTQRLDGKWSIQETIGHLLTVESLWEARFEEFAAGASELRPADLTNRRTEDAGFNDRGLAELLAGFRTARARIVAVLERFTEAQLVVRAHHPRLKRQMTAVDLAYFAAEHDDHHLARITELLRGTP